MRMESLIVERAVFWHSFTQSYSRTERITDECDTFLVLRMARPLGYVACYSAMLKKQVLSSTIWTSYVILTNDVECWIKARSAKTFHVLLMVLQSLWCSFHHFRKCDKIKGKIEHGAECVFLTVFVGCCCAQHLDVTFANVACLA